MESDPSSSRASYSSLTHPSVRSTNSDSTPSSASSNESTSPRTSHSSEASYERRHRAATHAAIYMSSESHVAVTSNGHTAYAYIEYEVVHAAGTSNIRSHVSLRSNPSSSSPVSLAIHNHSLRDVYMGVDAIESDAVASRSAEAYEAYADRTLREPRAASSAEAEERSSESS